MYVDELISMTLDLSVNCLIIIIHYTYIVDKVMDNILFINQLY